MTELAVDYSAGPPSAAHLAQHGVKAVGRYVAPRRLDGSRRPKCLTPAERDDLLAHGVDIFLVFEDNIGNALGVDLDHVEEVVRHAIAGARAHLADSGQRAPSG